MLSDLLGLTAIAVSALTVWFVVKGLPSYISSYLAEKGKHLATHEDLAMVVTQLKETTRATEEIRTLISEELWLRQEQWKLKRDTYLKAIASIGELFNIQGRMQQVEVGQRRGTVEERTQHLAELAAEQKAAMTEFRAARTAAAVVLAPEAVLLMDRYQDVSSRRNVDAADFHAIGLQALHTAFTELAQLARKELGLPAIEDIPAAGT